MEGNIAWGLISFTLVVGVFAFKWVLHELGYQRTKLRKPYDHKYRG